MDKYARQLTSLELGQLTEDLLLPVELQKILMMDTAQFTMIPTVKWYYEHISIQPIWGDEDRLVYRAKLPLISPTEYIFYQIYTWPLPYNATGYSAQFEEIGEVNVSKVRYGALRHINTKVLFSAKQWF